MSILVVERWMEYNGTVVHSIDMGKRRAYVFLIPSVAVVADGAADAYNPENTGSGNVRRTRWPDGDWSRRLVADPKRPLRPLQQAVGRHAGCFVSITALSDFDRSRTDPAAYVDAGRIPYLVLPESLRTRPGTGDLGDFVVAYQPANHRSSHGLIGDIGPERTLGEVSMRMASDLSGQRADARGRGAPTGPCLFVVFPESRLTPSWPMAPAAIRTRCEHLLRAMGGAVRLPQLVDALQESDREETV
ncbi:hypothetical protein [Pseudomonas sp. CGJS7]|uniref:hypothetical protein n=1 Tax=Pseudomonas sp. CGJS7 TaxID=3109348 RepID=UPI0030080A91